MKNISRFICLFFISLLFANSLSAQAPVANFACPGLTSSFPVDTCGSAVLVFTNTSTGTYNKAVWSLDQNSTGCNGVWVNSLTGAYTGASYNHNYSAIMLTPGYYRLCLKVINTATGQADSICKCIAVVHALPTAGFTVSDTIGCDPLTTKLIPSNPNTIPPYSFSFILGTPYGVVKTTCNGAPNGSCGDTTVTYNCNPTQACHPVFYIVKDGNGCQAVYSSACAFKVFCNPVASITVPASASSCVTGVPVTLSASPTTSTFYSWWVPTLPSPSPLPTAPNHGPQRSKTQTVSFSSYGCYDVKLAVYDSIAPGRGCVDTVTQTNAVCLQGIQTVPPPSFNLNDTVVCCGSPFQVFFTANTIPASSCNVVANFLAIPLPGSPSCADTVVLGSIQSSNGNPGSAYFSISCGCSVPVKYKIVVKNDSILNQCSSCQIKYNFKVDTIKVNPSPVAAIKLATGYYSSYCAPSHQFCFNLVNAPQNLPGYSVAWSGNVSCSPPIGSTTSSFCVTFSGNGTAANPTQDHELCLKVCQSAANGGCCSFTTDTVYLSKPSGTVSYKNSVGCGSVCDTFRCSVKTDSLYTWIVWDSAGVTTSAQTGPNAWWYYHCFKGFQHKDTCYNVMLVHKTFTVGGISCFDTILIKKGIRIGHKIKAKAKVSTKNICLKRLNPSSAATACINVYPDSSMHIIPSPTNHISQCTNLNCFYYFTRPNNNQIVAFSSNCDSPKICFNDTGKYVGHFIIYDNGCADTMKLDTICVSGIMASLIDSGHCANQNAFQPIVTFKPKVKYKYCGGNLPVGDSLKVHLWNKITNNSGFDVFDTTVAPGKVPVRYNYSYNGGGTYYVCLSAYDKFHLLCDTDTVCQNVIVSPFTAVIQQTSPVKPTIACRNGIDNRWCFSATAGSSPTYPPVVIWKWGYKGQYKQNTPGTHDADSACFVFDSCGTFQLRLIIGNASGSCQDSTTYSVVVHSLQDSLGGNNYVKVTPSGNGCNTCLLFTNKIIGCGTTLGTTVIHFGDPANTTQTITGNWTSITHCYSSNYISGMKVDIWDANGCHYPTQYINNPPAVTGVSAKWSGLPDTVLCLGTQVALVNASSGYTAIKSWKLSALPDSCTKNAIATSTTDYFAGPGPNSPYTFSTLGYYHLNFHVANNYTDANGNQCQSDTCVIIHIQNPRVNLASVPDTFPCPGTIANIPNLTTGAYDSLNLLINLPDGLNISYAYSKNSPQGLPNNVQVPLGYPGLYSLRWYVSSRLGCSDSLSKVFFVKGPRGKFRALSHHGCVGDIINFVDTTNSFNGVLMYWDDNVGNEQIAFDSTGNYSFSHQFTTCGKRTVLAYISDGSCIYAIKDTVNIDCPKANFGRVPAITSFCGSATVNFYDSSLSSSPHVYGASITSRTWQLLDSFGNVVQTFNTQNPVVTINQAGSYSMKLKIKTNWGCVDSMLQSNIINIYKFPTAQFTNSPDTVCINGCINFTDVSVNPDTGKLHYRWYFDYALNTITSTLANPQICYTSSGVFHTILIDTTMHGCIDTSNIKNVVVLPPVVANFTVADTIYCGSSAPITFTNHSTPNAGLTYCWNFGDSLNNVCQSSATNPTHTFTLPSGVASICYTIKLISINALSCKDSTSKMICMYSLPHAGLNVIPTSACDTLHPTVLDASSSLNPINGWDLSWGDTSTTHVKIFPSGLTHYYYAHDSFNIKYVVTTQQGCKDSTVVKVFNFAHPIACAGNDTLVCAQQPVQIGCPTLPAGYYYHWIRPGGIGNQFSANPIVTTNTSQYYVLYMRDNVTGCSSEDSMKISVIPLVVPVAGSDTGVCLGNSVTLYAHGGLTYTWRDSLNNIISTDSIITVTPANSTNYNVTICGSCDCATVPINVQIFQLPVIYLNHDIVGQVAGQPVTVPPVVSVGVGNIAWSPNYNINCTNCPSPVFTPDVTTTYHVVVTDGHGCIDSSAVTIHVLCDESNAVYVPNAFTPESKGPKGNNDRFYIQGTGVKELNYMRIYDRWGGIVFNAEHVPIGLPEFGWDGTSNGKVMSSDVFMYQIQVQCADGNVFNLTGTITLIR